MPSWLFLILWRVVVPLVITVLRKAGLISWAEALAGRTIVAIKNMKTYHEPEDFPHPPPKETNIHNFTVGRKQKGGPP